MGPLHRLLPNTLLERSSEGNKFTKKLMGVQTDQSNQSQWRAQPCSVLSSLSSVSVLLV